MPTQLSATKNFCFTIHEKHGGDPDALREHARYLVYQTEICPDTQREHIQGYVEFLQPKRITALLKICPAHYEQRRGSAVAAMDYCLKDESRKPDTQPTEFGEKPQESNQGHRADLDGLRDLIAGGGNLLDCYESNFGSTCRYTRGLKEYIDLKTPPRDWKPEVKWFWGAPDSGKSRRAREIFSDRSKTYTQDGTKWWDGYIQQPDVIVDDFTGAMPIADFLRAFDRYEHRVQTKGGYTPCTLRRVIITSNFHPKDCYKGHPQLAAVLRRIDEIIFFPFGTQDAVQEILSPQADQGSEDLY